MLVFSPEAPDHFDRQQLTYLRRYDAGNDPPPNPYRVSDAVMIQGYLQYDDPRKRHPGFLPKWLGSYNIQEINSGQVYTVDRDATPIRVPEYDAKPAFSPEKPVPADVAI